MLSGSKTWPPWLTSQTAGGMFHGAPPPQAALIPAFTTQVTPALAALQV